MTFYERRAEWERQEIRRALASTRRNVQAAAQQLGVSRTNLYRKCEKLGMPIARFGRAWAAQGL